MRFGEAVLTNAINNVQYYRVLICNLLKLLACKRIITCCLWCECCVALVNVMGCI